MSVGKVLVSSSIKYHYSKAKLFGNVQVYSQGFIRVVVDKSEGMA